MRSNETAPVHSPIQRLVVATDDNYPPFIFRDESGNLCGYLPDVWRLWSEKTSIEVQLVGTNWACAQQLMLEGRADVIDTMFDTPDRRQRYHFLDPYAEIEVPLFVHRDIGGVSSPSDLRPFVVAAKAGDAAVDWLRSSGVSRIELYSSYETLLAAVTAGMVRVFTVDRPPAMYYLTRWGCVDQFRIGFVMYTGRFHRAVRKDHDGLAAILQAGFNRISRAEDTALRARWFGRPLAWGRWAEVAMVTLAVVLALLVLLTIAVSVLRRVVRQRTRELEEAIRAKEATAERLRGTLAAAPVGIGVVRHRVLQEVNDRLCEMTGYSREQLIGRSARLLYPDEAEFERVGRLKYAEIRRTGHGVIETRWRRADGEVRDIWLSSVMLRGSGEEERVLFSALDITELKQAERALAAREAELAALLRELPGAVYRGRPDRGGGLRFLSDGAEAITGRPVAVFVSPSGPPLDSIIEPTERSRVAAEREQALRERGSWEGEYPIRSAGGAGDVKWVWERVAVLERASDGEIWQGYLTDVTSLKRANERLLELERDLQQAQKLESLGLLASGIAHNFNNVLTAILGHVSLAAESLPVDSAARADLLAAERAVRQASALTQQLLAYAGRAPAKIQPVNLSAVVLALEPVLRVSVPRRIELKLHCPPDLPPIRGDVSQIQQVVMNLVINAGEAIGDRPGIVSISTEVRAFDRAALRSYRLQEDRPEGTYVVLEVADTGCGLTPAQAARIFEPFFSTKLLGRGLGLSTVLGIVRAHRGMIGVESEPGLGSIFRVLFPVHTEPIAPPEEIPAAPAEWRGTGTVLLVDDEEIVRSVCQRLLERLGFEVVTAADGREAIRIYHEHHERLAAVILDLTMPHLDGADTCRHLLAIRRGVPMLLASGYDEHDLARRYADIGFAAFVHKPFSLDGLRETLRKVLGS